MYTVIKRMEVSAAHSLKLSYRSKCENLHGHNWIITVYYNPQIQISVVSGTKRSIFRQKNKTKRSKKKAAHNTYKAGAKG